MEGMDSVFMYQLREIELRQKLTDVTLELENQKNMIMELFNLLKIAYEERDEARSQLQELMNKLMLPTTTTKASTSSAESYSLSHGSSPPVDSSFSSPAEFTNINEVDSNNNIGYLNPHNLMVSSEQPKPDHDPATIVIESLAKGRALPQKGKLLQAVMDAGPLLQTLLFAWSLPTWKNPPPPLQHLPVKESDAVSIEPNSFADDI